ncbi:MAG: hypothetical protein U5J99_06640 [Parvularculaceae bacterium]|nr:hypothetical protein [Parvularculaceae bacterium]
MKKNFVLIALLGLGALPAAAQDGAPPALNAMRLDNGALTGPGADLLLADIPAAQFILVGEDHGFADPPEIAHALAKAARPYGLVNHVVEIGPLTDEWVEARLAEGGPDALAKALNGRPLAMPFLGMREDAVLADYFLKNAPRRRDVLWGVDQEFIGAPLIWFERLEALAPSDTARTLAADALAKERDAFAMGDFGAMFMFTAAPETFAAFSAAFAGVKDAGPIIEALRESAAIYRDYNAGKNFASNVDRIALIRREFLRQYGTAKGPAPRVLMKMGATHLGLGTSTLSTFDLGSLTEGIAAGNGLGVLRILILPLSGKQTTIAPSADGAFKIVDKTFELTAEILKAIGVDDAAIASEGYTVIALEPARRALEQKKLNALTSEQRFFILGYDYLITTKSARAATPLASK